MATPSRKYFIHAWPPVTWIFTTTPVKGTATVLVTAADLRPCGSTPTSDSRQVPVSSWKLNVNPPSEVTGVVAGGSAAGAEPAGVGALEAFGVADAPGAGVGLGEVDAPGTGVGANGPGDAPGAGGTPRYVVVSVTSVTLLLVPVIEILPSALIELSAGVWNATIGSAGVGVGLGTVM